MSIKDHLRKEPKGRKLLQARVDKSLYEKLRLKLKEDEISIRDFMEASMQQFLKEK